MAFDALRGVTVLFGGETPGVGRLADTWEWDGETWTERLPVSSPPARNYHSLVYDSVRGRVVLFGGATTTQVLADTWEWDGVSWTQRSPAISPPPTCGHAAAFSPTTGRMVVFGGTGGGAPVADTWEWDGNDWNQVRGAGSSPPHRWMGSMGYDSSDGSFLLFGGAFGTAYLGDTWQWGSSAWTHVQSTPQPSARSQSHMVCDHARARILLFAGDAGTAATGSIPSNEAWEWNGASWAPASTVNTPPARFSHAMAYDSVRGRTVMFAGYGSTITFGDTWELLDAVPASAHIYGFGCGVPAVTIAPPSGARPVLGTAQVSNITNAYLGLAFVAWGTTPQAIDLDFAGFTGCTLWHGAEGEIAAGCTQTSWNTAQHSLFIPVDPLLVGVHIYLQAWTLAPGYNPIGLATSNGVDLLIGDV